MLRLKWRGRGEMARNISRCARNMPGEMGEAQYDVCSEEEMPEMKRRCPVWNPRRPVPPGHRPGSLRDSGMVHPPEHRGTRVSTRMTFGNDEVDYAVYVHEDLEAEHAIGQAKFMESVMNESRPYIGRRLASRINLERTVRG